ncbi:MAG: Stp1/IreP family PP2C-type Ser/Thr phosphatase [Anaerolineae bacterium]|nr:Stp1/IreP family PP2C-type Ser/Thr phosphatase [Anaerolineae bacterium]
MAESIRIIASFRTDKGRVRENNQDFVAWREPDTQEARDRDGWLYLLADGAGGMDAGELASRYATERLLEHYVEGAGERDWGLRLHRAMLAANSDLRQLSASQAAQNRMATTMVAAVIAGDKAYIGNVGDSRAYLWRAGALQQITRDQSLVAKLVEEGAITEEEAATHPRRHVILYSLGSVRDPQVDIYELTLNAGDQILLCSDGLTAHVEDDELAAILGEQDPEEASAALVQLANERGGQDNISVGVLRVLAVAKERAALPIPEAERPVAAPARAFLWSYTLFLSLLQTALICLLWFFLLF